MFSPPDCAARMLCQTSTSLYGCRTSSALEREGWRCSSPGGGGEDAKEGFDAEGVCSEYSSSKVSPFRLAGSWSRCVPISKDAAELILRSSLVCTSCHSRLFLPLSPPYLALSISRTITQPASPSPSPHPRSCARGAQISRLPTRSCQPCTTLPSRMTRASLMSHGMRR